MVAPRYVADALTSPARLAPAAHVGEKTSLRAFYQRSRAVNRLDHDAAIRALIARVLVSPSFLYRLETVAAAPERQLNGWELASRMSFFLWSSIPDDELRRAAAAGELNDPARLARQVKRMTADPKARRFATEFFGQWLGFYHFDQYRGVDTGRFPEFTEDVKSAMYDEAISTRAHRPARPPGPEILPPPQFCTSSGGVLLLSRESFVRQDSLSRGARVNRGGALRPARSNVDVRRAGTIPSARRRILS